jgi:hypothetical protein
MPKQQKPLITYKKKPNNTKELDQILHPLVKKWFYSRFKTFSLNSLYLNHLISYHVINNNYRIRLSKSIKQHSRIIKEIVI